MFAELYLNYYKNTIQVNQQQKQNKIIFCARYVDNTFIIFNATMQQAKILTTLIIWTGSTPKSIYLGY